MKKTIFAIACMLFFNVLCAQNTTPFCGYDTLLKSYIHANPGFQQTLDDYETYLSNYNNSNSKPNTTNAVNAVIIPVVVHIIHAPGDALGSGTNISYLQVLSQINALNKAFNNNYLPPQTTGPNAVNPNIQFCLATLPSPSSLTWAGGPSEPGVMRYPSVFTDHLFTTAGSNDLLSLTHLNSTYFPFNKYLNIWVVNTIDGNPGGGGVAGYAPNPLTIGNPLDGIVIRANVFGDNTNNLTPFNLPLLNSEGKILAHEVGHYLFLKHTFEGGCAGGDNVADTPPCIQPSSNICSTSPVVSCSNVTQIENYMYYSADACWNTFTAGQSLRMDNFIATSRSNLVSLSNLSATGVAGGNGCVPSALLADFTYNPSQPCINSPINFSTQSGPGYSATSWAWTFPGGVPSSSTLQNPSVVYSATGNYIATLISSDGAGNTQTTQQTIFVNACNNIASSQGNWYFGQYAGLNFSSGVPAASRAAFDAVPRTINTLETSVTASDQNGNLLFYSDAVSVWNYDHELIQTGLGGSTDATQCLTVPRPGNTDQHYIFQLTATSPAFSYSILDMSQPCGGCPTGGDGQVTTLNTNINIPGNAFIAECITAVPHCNGIDYWIIVAQRNVGTFFVYKLTNTGLSAPTAYSSSFPTNFGMMKASPDGKKIAITKRGGNAGLAVYDFNNTTGAITNFTPFFVGQSSSGISFSPNSNILYATVGALDLQQIDLINNTTTLIQSSPPGNVYTLQLAPDNKIYGSKVSSINLCVIHNPNALGLSCSFNAIGPVLDNLNITPFILCATGLPNMVDARPVPSSPSFAVNNTGCNSFQFDVDPCYASFTQSWNFGDNTTATVSNPSHTYTGPGPFVVTLTLSYGNITLPSITENITIQPVPALSIEGLDHVCQATPNYYSVLPSTGYTYNWSISPANAGTFSGPNTGANVIVNWTGNGILSVNASNCVSTSMNVTLNQNPNSVATSPGVCVSTSCGGVANISTTGGLAPYTYSWNETPAQTGTSATGLCAGSHNVTTTDANGCSTVSFYQVNVANIPLTISLGASANPICNNGQSTSISLSGANTYILQSTGATLTNPFIVNPSSTTTYMINGSNAAGCSGAGQITINVQNPPVVTLVSSPANPICINTPVTITASSTDPTTTYIWNTSATGNTITDIPGANTTYVVTGTSGPCSVSTPITVNVQTCNSCTSNCFLTLGTTIGSASFPANNTYCLNNDLLITGSVSFTSSELKVGAGWKIIVANGANLTIFGSHVYSCSDMWQGIEVQDGGTLTIRRSLIEDALIAVDVTNNTQTSGNVFTLANTTFNRNDVSVFINGYTPSIPNYPFAITNCVFTCRNIPYSATPGPISFHSSAMVGGPNASATPFTNSVIDNTTYSQTSATAFLKAPFAANVKSSAAIRLKEVGATLNPQNTVTTYYEFVLGGLANKNIIDNHRIGVDLIGSNFTSYNTTYQNTATFGKGSSGGGIGINATVPDERYNNRLRVTSPINNANFGNKFVDCSRAINTFNYFEHLITLNDIRSSQAWAPVVLNNHRGQYGVKSITNRYKAYKVSDNTIYNIENGIIMDATFGLLNIGTIVSSSSQYSGQINVDNNTIASQVGTPVVTSNYVSNAIAISDIISAPYNIIPVSPTATSLIQTANNTITDVYRGIAYMNWEKATSMISTNTIKLVPDLFSANAQQFGIGLSGSQANVNISQVKSNTINGFGITANTKVYGIVDNISSRINVNCNTTIGTYNGIAFAGHCFNTKFNNNIMNTNHYGFALLNVGDIGQQGTPTSPQDNRWTGTWTGHFKTGVLSNSSAQTSKLYIRTSAATSPFNPNGSSFLYFGGIIGTDEYSIFNGALTPTTSNPFYIGCPVILNGGGGPPSFVINRLEQIALDLINYQTNVQQTRTINKNQVYRLLKAEPSLMTGSAILQTFYTNSQSTNRKTFDDIETGIASGDVTTANNLNAAVTTTNNVEINYKAFYDLAIKQAEGTITTNDSLALATLAYGCPFTDGVMVYQARVMLNVMYDMYMVYPDNCPTQTSSRFGKTTEEEADIADENKFDAVLFPNPGANTFNMATFGLTDGDIEVSISDVTGKQVFKNTLSVVNALTLFDLDVKNGVYFVKITNNDKSIIKKLVVQQ